jgi:magnesium chelatase subunit H
MGSPGAKSKGPPPAVKKLLGLFGSQREEDRMVGYLSFLKLGPKLLKFLPGKPILLIFLGLSLVFWIFSWGF